MNSNIDLHLHSYYSDGNESPTRIVERAKSAGFDCIALTDHDGCLGIDEFLEAGKSLGLKTIPGIEFSAEYDGAYMHILGYGIDHNEPKLKAVLLDILKKRDARNDKLTELFNAKGIDMTRKDLESFSPNGFIGKVSFAKLLVKKGLAEDVQDAFNKYLTSPDVKAIRKEKINAEDAINLIHGAGGKVFFAHPFQTSFGKELGDAYSKKLNALLFEFAEGIGKSKAKIDGIEVCYPTHSKDETDFLLSVAKRCNLLVSRGSDDHGEGIRKVKIMGQFDSEIDSALLEWTSKMW